MFEELINKLLPSINHYKIHYFSIGCAESDDSTINPKYICQQFPTDLRDRSENLCIYLIDNALQSPTYIELLLNQNGYILTSMVKIDSIHNSSINTYVSSKNTIQLVILRSNDIYTYNYINEKYVMPKENFDFFSLLISLIYDNYDIGIFQTYSGQTLAPIHKFCKINGYLNSIMVGITCGYDFSCYVRNVYLTKLHFKQKCGNLRIMNPNIIPNFNLRKKYLKHAHSDYGKQILYIMNSRIFGELRAIAYLLDFITKLINRNERLDSEQMFYHSNIPDFDTLKPELLEADSMYIARDIVLQLFNNHFHQCLYYIPVEMKNNYIYYDDISKENVAVVFVRQFYSAFCNIYPLQTIDINN